MAVEVGLKKKEYVLVCRWLEEMMVGHERQKRRYLIGWTVSQNSGRKSEKQK